MVAVLIFQARERRRGGTDDLDLFWRHPLQRGGQGDGARLRSGFALIGTDEVGKTGEGWVVQLLAEKDLLTVERFIVMPDRCLDGIVVGAKGLDKDLARVLP